MTRNELKARIWQAITDAEKLHVRILPNTFSFEPINNRVTAKGNRCCPMTACALGQPVQQAPDGYWMIVTAIQNALGVEYAWVMAFTSGYDKPEETLEEMDERYTAQLDALLLGQEIRHEMDARGLVPEPTVQPKKKARKKK